MSPLKEEILREISALEMRIHKLIFTILMILVIIMSVMTALIIWIVKL